MVTVQVRAFLFFRSFMHHSGSFSIIFPHSLEIQNNAVIWWVNFLEMSSCKNSPSFELLKPYYKFQDCNERNKILPANEFCKDEIKLIRWSKQMYFSEHHTHFTRVDIMVAKELEGRNRPDSMLVFHIQRLWWRYRDKVVMSPWLLDNWLAALGDGWVPSGNTTVLNSLGICSYLWIIKINLRISSHFQFVL